MDMNQINTMSKLLQQIDLEKVLALSEKVDLSQLIEALGTMNPQDLDRMMKQVGACQAYKSTPPIDSDFYDIAGVFTEEERAYQTKVRKFMEKEVQPVINDYWERGEFPYELIPKFAKVLAETIGARPDYFAYQSSLRLGVIFMEIARVDPSLCTFFGVHWGLCMGTISSFGSAEQKAHWLPKLERLEKIGSWALTEPDVGSAAAAGLTTTARREGDAWILAGEKKWSGNATFADVNIIWARDESDNEVKGFLVEKGTPGYIVEKLGGKIAKRAVENVHIKLKNCAVPETNRLPGVTAFRDISRYLAQARVFVAWEAVGIAMGAYEHTLDYANNRIQFGRPITSFQLVQDGLVKMLGNITAMQTMLLRLSQLMIKHNTVSQARASLAKAFCAEKMRETVSIARGLLGGNGILLEYDVARYFANAEAVYSYEGAHEINTLIVGRAITGQSALV